MTEERGAKNKVYYWNCSLNEFEDIKFFFLVIQFLSFIFFC